MTLTLFLLFVFKPVEVSEYILKNGLKVIVYEEHFAPVVAVQIHYRIGSYNEPVGMTGISHLLEHMAFKGTKRYGPKEYDRIIDENGGEENAFTSIHQTVYWANLQKDRYEIALELEADRMENLLIAPADFSSEKNVVIEERRLEENDPYGNLFETLDLLSYTYHPYRQPIIGFMSDIERITRDDVYRWYKKFYNPANALIVIAGDVDNKGVLRQVKKHFGRIRGNPVKEKQFFEPPQNGERRFEVYKDVISAALAIHYHTVPINNKDSYPIDIIARILSYGKTSRFEKVIIQQKGLASSIWAYSSATKYGGSFVIFGIPQVGVEIGLLESAIDSELSRLKDGDFTLEEMERAKNQVLAQFVFRQDSPMGIGFSLGFWEIEGGNWRGINEYPKEIMGVTKEDIMRVANKYFIKDNRTVGYLTPRSKDEPHTLPSPLKGED
ncbi:MAG: pitrilysin family protein [candidate division WOR-3 bacterium]